MKRPRFEDRATFMNKVAPFLLKETVAPYPLHWPLGQPRTAAKARRFLEDHWDDRVCIERVTGKLFRLMREVGGESVILSTNQVLRHGLPTALPDRLDDPGAALYFEHRGKQGVFVCDRYLDLIDNIHSLSMAAQKLRYPWREGSDEQFVECIYEVAAALAVDDQWWKVVLELDAEQSVNLANCVAAYRRLSKRFHPDYPGGSHVAMQRLNAAIEEAKNLLT